MEVSNVDSLTNRVPRIEAGNFFNKNPEIFNAVSKALSDPASFDQYDKNGDQSLSMKELKTALFDTNNDGVLSKQESSVADKALKASGIDNMEDLHKMLDKNGDGNIDVSDWNALLDTMAGNPPSGGGGGSDSGGRTDKGGGGHSSAKPRGSDGGGSSDDTEQANQGSGGQPQRSGGSGDAGDQPQASGGGGGGGGVQQTSGPDANTEPSKRTVAAGQPMGDGFGGGVTQTPGGKLTNIEGSMPGQLRHQTGLSGYDSQGGVESFRASPGGELSGSSSSARSEAYFKGDTSGRSLGADFKVLGGGDVTIMQQFDSDSGPSLRASLVDGNKITVSDGDGSPTTIATIEPGQQFHMEMQDMGNGKTKFTVTDMDGTVLGEGTFDNTRYGGGNDAFRYGCYLHEAGGAPTEVLVSNVNRT